MASQSRDISRRPPRSLAILWTIASLIAMGLSSSCWQLNNNLEKRLVDAPARGIEIYHGSEVAANQVLIKFSKPSGLLDRNKIFNLLEKVVGEQISISEVGVPNTYLIKAKNKDAAALISIFNALANSPEVIKLTGSRMEYVEPNHVYKLEEMPSDEFFKSQWGLKNEGLAPSKCGSELQGPILVQSVLGADIHAQEAWDLLKNPRPIVVAVLDTGVKLNHDDLKNTIWRAPKNFDFMIGDSQINCKEGAHGFNAVTMKCDDAQIIDKTGHGTHVAGIIGADANNGLGIAGVSPFVKIMTIKISDDQGLIFDDYIINAIKFILKVNENSDAADQVRVLNNSYGHTCKDINPPFCQDPPDCQPTTLKAAMELPGASNLLFVASAGDDSGNNNDCNHHYPSGLDLPNVVSEAATDNADNLAHLTNVGQKTVHIGAPGIAICSLSITNSLYEYENGTSMSSAFVSGAAALVLSKCDQLDAKSLKDRLVRKSNVDSINMEAGKTIGGGRLNLEKAVSVQCQP
jgi:subtilisin family serine protease